MQSTNLTTKERRVFNEMISRPSRKRIELDLIGRLRKAGIWSRETMAIDLNHVVIPECGTIIFFNVKKNEEMVWRRRMQRIGLRTMIISKSFAKKRPEVFLRILKRIS